MTKQAIEDLRKTLAARNEFRSRYPGTQISGCDQDVTIAMLVSHIDRLTSALEIIGQGFSTEASIQSNAARLVVNGWDLKDARTVVASGKNS